MAENTSPQHKSADRGTTGKADNKSVKGKQKVKEVVPDARAIPNRDVLQRLNFMYQAGVYMSSLRYNPSKESDAEHDISVNGKYGQHKKRRPETTNEDTPATQGAEELARAYVGQMRIVAQKAVVRMDPGVKRNICRGCNIVLIPGHSASVRIKRSAKSRNRQVIYRCMTCGTARHLQAPEFDVGDDAQTCPDASGESHRSNKVSRQDPKYGLRQEDTNDLPLLDVSSEVRNTPIQRDSNKTKAKVPLALQRDAGHILFCGDERMPDMSMQGVYPT